MNLEKIRKEIKKNPGFLGSLNPLYRRALGEIIEELGQERGRETSPRSK
ncbi:MAG: hypothetical protein L6243_06165 [Candidatus Altiarchaeales archaeon]|nr:hypothetical protein [Candidatus Altiarchaeota archaeon]MBU4342309.1 hypothetical protein [Candidatus Altiarchaeota archaeon]MCG2783158.1 hypothetical protein [Candidatus Altiarchaeales archaeon]